MVTKKSIIIWAIIIGVWAVALALFLIIGFGKDISLTAEDGKIVTDTVEIRSLCLVPGGEETTMIHLRTKQDGNYKLHFEFQETKDSPLAQYVMVKISVGQTEIEKPLLSLLGGQTVDIESELDRTFSSPLRITYLIPTEIGNECSGKEANFDIILSVSQA